MLWYNPIENTVPGIYREQSERTVGLVSSSHISASDNLMYYFPCGQFFAYTFSLNILTWHLPFYWFGCRCISWFSHTRTLSKIHSIIKTTTFKKCNNKNIVDSYLLSSGVALSMEGRTNRIISKYRVDCLIHPLYLQST